MFKPLTLTEEAETEKLGQCLAELIHPPFIVFLQGDLGAGKTTLVRGFLRGLEYKGKVKSPTFTLVEEYHFPKKTIYHFDLYRLSHPEELEFIGIREYFRDDCIILIEWPEKGKGLLPQTDLLLTLNIMDDKRLLTLNALSKKATMVLSKLTDMRK